MIEVNYLIVLICTILSFPIAMVWYGPIFGKQWMKLNGVNSNDVDAVANMKKGMWKTLIAQFFSTFFLVYVLFIYLKAAADEMAELSNSLWICAGFIIPTLISTVLWTSEPTANKWKRLLIQAGYNVVMFAIFGYVIMNWG